ncbi:MAG: M48 family metallopeptidase [Planctomycetota bacterium]
MAVDFHHLIAANKRNSVILVIVIGLLILALGGVFGFVSGHYYGGGSPEAITTSIVTGLVLALVVAVISTVGSYYGGASAVLAMSKARRIEKKDDPQLFNVVEEMTIAAGLPMPKVYVIDDTAPNAFATGRDPAHGVVAVTTGLRSKLARNELQGVIAHEMAHIGNLDIRFAMLMATLVGVVVLLCDFFLRSMRWGFYAGGRSRRRSSGGKGGGALVLIMIVLGLILAIIAPLIAKLIQLAVSRQREFLADASAVELTRNPDGLCAALAKISGDKEVLEVANRATQHLYIVNPIKLHEKRAKSMFSTHPPLGERIKRIQSLTN